MPKQTVLVHTTGSHVRADKYLAELHPEYSRAALAKLFTLQLVKLHGESIQPGYKLKDGVELEYDLGPLQEKPDVIDIPIIYEDDDVLVINKPAGIISHARGRFWQEASVASFLRDRVVSQQASKKDADVLFDTQTITNATDINTVNQSIRAGIVHRLDRATSGVMICAKNKHTYTHLQQQFADRAVQKTYVAIVESAPKEYEATIQAPIDRKANDPKRFCVNANGKPAETHYKIIGESSAGCALELHPKTGRTHQLRVHLEYIDRPIIGDKLYGGRKNDRLLLHAYSLSIEITPGITKTFVAPIPDEFGMTHG